MMKKTADITAAKEGRQPIFASWAAFFAVVFWLAVWEILSIVIGSPLLLPSPLAVLGRLCTLLPTAAFWTAAFSTLFRVLTGSLLGCLFGAVCALLAFRFCAVRVLLAPILTVIRAVPVVSFILLALVWMGGSAVPAFISFLMVFPVVESAVIGALGQIDEKTAEMVQLFDFSPIRRFRYLELPAALPAFLSGGVTALGLGWKAGVAAEVLCAVKYSIGYHLHAAQIYLETTDLFAWTLTVIGMSLVPEALLGVLSRRLARHSKGDKAK